jgi:dolichol kinase
MNESVFFTLSVIVLAALLFLPVTRLVWVLSVRRLERRTGTVLDETERAGQLRRARLVALILVILFSLLFNLGMLGAPGRG